MKHLESNTPPGLRLEVVYAHPGGGAFSLSASSKYIAAAAKVLKDSFGTEVAYHWNGASIPVIPQLAQAAGNAEPVLVGFGLEEDQIHAPNESFSIEQFVQGFVFVGRFLQSL